ncbi:deoxyguanosinetriphosphate triphosphohydrolase-like protein [Alphaproteobacteria bacterium]|nr:deoxyguanosinetriphosphate triphosphohydrolase-like protein [Alphaproteobacteria bacterium]
MVNNSLASYAINEKYLRDRLYPEKKLIYPKDPFAVDYERIINSSAFRRLQYKTQVFVNHQGDHYRTRLTHSLEVAQIARSIAHALHLNRDLAENISLAHDLGHTAFGHAGEQVLNEKMMQFKGFSHNAHTFKIITKLETRFADFEGLNLSWEMLEGVAKHNGRFKDFKGVPEYILNYNKIFDLQLNLSPSLEAQISAIADDIAYNNHDLEDGLRAQLFSIQDLLFLPVIGEIYQEIIENFENLAQEILVGEAKKIITNRMIFDVINNTKKNLTKYDIKGFKDVQNHPNFLVNFSTEMLKTNQILKDFLMKKMYRHSLVNQMTKTAHQVISDLFDYYLGNPQVISISIKDKNYLNYPIIQQANLIADYIAGMTDRYAINLHSQIIK